MAKCTICEHRPAQVGDYCVNCSNQIKRETNNNNGRQPTNFLTYRGHVVGLFPNGGDKLRAELLTRSPEGLPNDKTIDLNKYCEGFDRSQIKRFKACILKLAYA